MRQRGFTLIEVLVALSIASIGLVALIKAQTQSTQNLQILQHKTLANLTASNLAIEMRLANKASLGFKNGEYQLGKQRWYWQSNTNSTPNSNIVKLSLLIFANKQKMSDKQPSTQLDLYLNK
jgi:general secretion pathway protein I